MTVTVKYKNGTYGRIADVKWHPEYGTADGQVDAELWVAKTSLESQLKRVNAFKAKINEKPEMTSVDDLIASIDFAEAEFMVYDDSSSDAPWMSPGHRMARIPYAGCDAYWKIH